MSVPKSPADFQNPDVLRSQRREWKVERVGWAAIALVLTFGALGGFGGGPLAHASRSSEAVELEFDRFVRHGVPTQLRFTIGPAAVVDNRIRVALDWSYLAAIDLVDVQPAPASSASSGGQLILDFAADAGGNNTIVFWIEPHDAGRQAGRVQVGRTVVEIRQFVFP